MNNYGYIKVAAATPSVRVADCEYNSERIVAMMQQAADKGVKAMVFPELCITASTFVSFSALSFQKINNYIEYIVSIRRLYGQLITKE